jgi:two-component system, response regulator
MPKISGIEALEEIKKDPQLKKIPVVMLTSSRQDADVEKCYRSGANAYVVKPVDFQQFVAAVRTIGQFWGVVNEVSETTASGVAAGD